MKKFLRLTLFTCLLLPLSATAKDKARVTIPSCIEGNAYTINIPFKLPKEVDTVWYRWYYNGQHTPVATGVATHSNRKISYTIPVESSYGENIELYFEYRLNDNCRKDCWTASPKYSVSFVECPIQSPDVVGKTVVCEDATGLTYALEHIEGITHAWTVPDGWTITENHDYGITANPGSSGVISVQLSSICGNITTLLAVTVNKLSTLTHSGGAASQTVCQNSAITNIVYTLGGSATGSSIAWQPSAPAGISYNATTGTISGAPTSVGTFTYTITTSGHAAPCTAVTATGTLTVNQASTLTRSGGAASQTVCQNTAITNIVYTRGGSASGFSTISWSPSAPAGVSASISGSAYTISGTPTGTGTFSYTIATTGHTSPCAAITATGTLTVNTPSTLVRSGGEGSQTVCAGTAITSIVYTRGGSASGFSAISWSPSAPAGVSSSISGSTYTISGTPTAGGTFTYTITTTGHTAPCTAATATGTLTVNTVPAQPSAITGSAVACAGQSGLTYSVTNVPGVTYTWQPAGYSQTAGGTTSSITVTAGSSIGTGTVRVTPSNGCGSGTQQTLSVRTIACPPTTCAGLSSAGAIGVSGISSSAWSSTIVLEPGTAISLTSESPAFGTVPITYQWFRSGNPIGGANDASYNLPVSEARGVNVEFRRGVSCGGGYNYSNTITIQFCTTLPIGTICWARTNVDSYQQFADIPDMYTQFYQWGRNTPWPATGGVSGWNTAWDNTNEPVDWGTNLGGATPCPEGWRVPTQPELKALHDAGTTWVDAASARGNAVAGRFYGPNHNNSGSCSLPNNMNNCIFLPAGGIRATSNGNLSDQSTNGRYWSSPGINNRNSYHVFFRNNLSDPANNVSKLWGMNIRCVQ